MAKRTTVKRIRHNGGLKGLKRRLDDASNVVAVAGILGPKGQTERGGLTTAQIGALHEYGYTFTSAAGNRISVPARSFVRLPIREAGPRLKKMLARGAAKVAGGSEAAAELEKVALFAQGVMQKAISKGLAPPLAESTIARRKGPRRGHSGPRVIKPLLDTGQLRSAITSAVRWKRGSR